MLLLRRGASKALVSLFFRGDSTHLATPSTLFFSLFWYIARHFIHKLPFLSILVSNIGVDNFCDIGCLTKFIKLHYVETTASSVN